MKILGISGSVRRHSYNSGLLRAAAGMMPQGVELEIASIADIPLYDGDREEAEGLPQAVVALKERIAATDGLLLATPEYNGSVPGVLKNAIDWASRPYADAARLFGGRPVALIGASTGGYGTRWGQEAWAPVARALNMRLWTGDSLMVPHAGDAFDGQGDLVDGAIADRLRAFVTGFVGSIGAG